jgi:hypothetical protein
MTIHQVNQDGAGPFECMVSADATGNNFQPMTVTTNVPGRNVPIIGSLSGATVRPRAFVDCFNLPGAGC